MFVLFIYSSQDPRIEEQDLKLVFGIQSTNGALLHFPPGYGRALGVFPIQAFLNHSCMLVFFANCLIDYDELTTQPKYFEFLLLKLLLLLLLLLIL